MKTYLLSLYQPGGPAPEPEVLESIMRELAVLNQELTDAGAFVFAAGLAAPDTATVVRATGDDVTMTDGPYAEAKEHVGGLSVIQAPDLDTALAWAERMARITTLPIEVRPFQG